MSARNLARANVSQKHRPQVTDRALRFRKVIIGSIYRDLHMQMPNDVAQLLRLVVQKTGVPADELVADILRDALAPLVEQDTTAPARETRPAPPAPVRDTVSAAGGVPRELLSG